MPNPDKGLVGDCIKLWKYQQLVTADESQKWHIRRVCGSYSLKWQQSSNWYIETDLFNKKFCRMVKLNLEVNSPPLAWRKQV